MKREQLGRYLYIGCLSGLGMFLPLSEFMTSVFMILLSLSWLLAFNASKVLETASAERRSLWFLLSFLVYIIWIFFSQNKEVALAALRLKLPLLALPVIIITTPLPDLKERKIILYSFLSGVLIASFTGYIIYSINRGDISDTRDIALFVSHIRLSLMLIMAVAISLYCASRTGHAVEKWLLLFAALSSLVFLIRILSFTGIVISAAVCLFLIVRVIKSTSSLFTKYALPAGFIIFLLIQS